jgi:hypothetical protein
VTEYLFAIYRTSKISISDTPILKTLASSIKLIHHSPLGNHFKLNSEKTCTLGHTTHENTELSKSKEVARPMSHTMTGIRG